MTFCDHRMGVLSIGTGFSLSCYPIIHMYNICIIYIKIIYILKKYIYSRCYQHCLRVPGVQECMRLVQASGRATWSVAWSKRQLHIYLLVHIHIHTVTDRILEMKKGSRAAVSGKGWGPKPRQKISDITDFQKKEFWK